MLVVYSKQQEEYQPPGQIHFGERGRSPDTSERSRQIAAALSASGYGTLVEPGKTDLKDIEAVHDRDYLNYLQTANQQPILDPESDGLPMQVLFPATFLYSSLWPARHTSVMADSGFYSFDTYAPVTSSVWPSALLSAGCALTASNLLLDGEKVSMALCRPPGHHAMRAKCGGFCYLNNAAIAAQHLTQAGKVAILDVDYHHGNGTQEIFYDTDQVMYASLHADPNKAYPYFSGYSEERGIGKGLGFNLNIPLPAGTNEVDYDQALESALQKIKAFSPHHLVLSLGFDICASDPLSTFTIQPAYFNTMAKRIAKLTLPTVIVIEGGYAVESLGGSALRFVQGWFEGI